MAPHGFDRVGEMRPRPDRRSPSVARARCAGRDGTARIGGVILIIAPLLPGQQTMPSMVVVVVPLRAVFALRGIGKRIEQTRAVVVILQHEMDKQSARCLDSP